MRTLHDSGGHVAFRNHATGIVNHGLTDTDAILGASADITNDTVIGAGQGHLAPAAS